MVAVVVVKGARGVVVVFGAGVVVVGCGVVAVVVVGTGVVVEVVVGTGIVVVVVVVGGGLSVVEVELVEVDMPAVGTGAVDVAVVVAASAVVVQVGRAVVASSTQPTVEARSHGGLSGLKAKFCGHFIVFTLPLMHRKKYAQPSGCFW